MGRGSRPCFWTHPQASGPRPRAGLCLCSPGPPGCLDAGSLHYSQQPKSGNNPKARGWLNDTQNVAYTHCDMLFRLTKEWSADTCHNMDVHIEDILLN